jgi:signal transduction histidine kinase/CheY-like chemotaxis protein
MKSILVFCTILVTLITNVPKIDGVVHDIVSYHEFYDPLPQLIWVTSPMGEVIFLNKCWKTYVGSDTAPWIDALHPDDVSRTLEERRLAFQEESAFDTKYRLRDVHGNYQWFLARALPLKDENGQIYRWYGVNTNIDATINAIEREKANNVFFASSLHELKTPITGIIGLVDLLQETQLDDQQRRDMNTILQCGSTVISLISDLLDFCRLENHKITLENFPYNIEELAEHVLKVGRLFRHQQIKLQVAPQLRIPNLIMGDKDRVRQIFTNLVTNAVKFSSKDNGNIHVDINVHQGSHQSTPSNRIIVIQVADDGIGMSDEQQRNLFQPFTDSKKGHGLGLYITKMLVELMNGSIEVQSKLGVGTRFTVYLPYHENLERRNSAAESFHLENDPMSKSLRNYGVMVVDDNRIIRDLVNRILTQAEYVVFSCANGQEAIDVYQEHHNTVDMILLDLNYNDQTAGYIGDGSMIANEIRTLESSQQLIPVPIIAFTASVSKTELEEAMKAGMNGVILKPFKNKDLLQKVRLVLYQQS